MKTNIEMLRMAMRRQRRGFGGAGLSGEQGRQFGGFFTARA
jgi:hypothetical protein